MESLLDILKYEKPYELEQRSLQALTWFRQRVQSMKLSSEGFYRQSELRKAKRYLEGRMYLFFYDAKTKDTLPYFDRMPLVFPFKKVAGGFYGLNLHYLPLTLRARLMDALYDTASNSRYDESTRLKINYKLLDNAAKYKGFKPCVKRYLTSQLRSRFMYIYPSEWDVALFLPTERFQGASKTQVWSDTRKNIG